LFIIWTTIFWRSIMFY